MDIRQQLRSRITNSKIDAAGQTGRKFLPADSIDHLLPIFDILAALEEDVFRIPVHKRSDTADWVLEEGRIIFAMLLETNLECKLPKLIEEGVTDNKLPLDEPRVQHIFEEHTAHFIFSQWSFLPYTFKKYTFHRKLERDRILPYVEEQMIGGGGFSKVYKLRIHSRHNRLDVCSGQNSYLVRKKLEVLGNKGTQSEESELLFLLGALDHRNIVKLLAAYTQDGIPNLIFEQADFDLQDLLKEESRPPLSAEDGSIFKAMHGLASGLQHLHSFNLDSTGQRNASNMPMKGCHHDLKPRNVLVRGADFILADFGLARLKHLDEDSKTPFQNATRDYGAPECEDPETFEKGKVGRASDIWSLACIILEVITYVEKGPTGVDQFREGRVYQSTYGKARAFHKDRDPHPFVKGQIESLRTASRREPPLSGLYSFVTDMLSIVPSYRPSAEKVQLQLARSTVQLILGTLMQSIHSHAEISSISHHTSVFRTRLQLESNRICAWSGALGLLRLDVGSDLEQQLDIPRFQEVFASFKTAAVALPKAGGQITSPEALQDHEDSVIASLYQLNNYLYGILSNEQKLMGDSLFAGLITANENTNVLAAIQKEATHSSTSQYENVGAMAAMKYMAILYSKDLDVAGPTPRLDPALISRDTEKNDRSVRPPSYWYEYDLGQPKKVHVEIIGYGQHWMKDLKSEDFKHTGEMIFSRIQKLAALMKKNPNPQEFRALSCIGAYHNAQERHFGIVHAIPNQNHYPVRLHHILSHRKLANQPSLDEKCRLAYTLASSINKLHLSGWLHKDLNSFNIVFFHHSADRWESMKYQDPYIIGFDHSREDQINAYTEGPVDDMMVEYQHPLYQSREVSFRKAFDRYSLGLLLLEIGLWAPLSNIYGSQSNRTASPEELSRKYMKYCQDKLPMFVTGRYCQATTKCLELGSHTGDPVEADQLFQTQVMGSLGGTLN